MNSTQSTQTSLVASPPAGTGLGSALSTGRLSGLDGLRAIAVIAVIVYHFFPDVLPGGFIGVDIFFVISGFLITGLLVSERTRTGRVSLRNFWQRRARRLVPPLVPVLLVCSTAAWLIGGDVLVGLGAQLLGAVTFGYNWVSIAGNASYFAVDQPELFRNLWSLAVEEQFYVIWPLLLLAILLIRRPWMRLALVAVLAAASMWWMAGLYQPGADPTRVYYGSDTHSFGLLTGATLALLLRRPAGLRNELPRLRPWLGGAALLGIAAAAVWLPEDGTATYRGGLAVVSLLTAVAIWAGVRGGRFGRLLDVTPLRYVGERSYGIYLWHWPVLVLLQVALPGQPSVWRLALIGLLAGAITLGASAASYRWLEQPVRRDGVRGGIRRVSLAWRLPVRGRVLVISLVAALVLSSGGTAAALVTAPSTATAELEIERGQQALDAAKDAARQAASTPAPLPGGDLITAVGDSVMLASAAELQGSFPGIAIDAAVSRGMYSAAGILAELNRAGTLRPVVVVGLGTNGPIKSDELKAIESAIGSDRKLILVNAYADRDWTNGVNASLADFSARHRLVELANWHDAIASRTELLSGDGVHPGTAGGQVYANTVTAALQRLAGLPPLRLPGENRLLPAAL
ncbi:acyltransferase family protein [Cryobacterium psychrophilum]|uniref:Acetyltransferase n=1 Tax=Cryobacterium psychrophilum TaxID=41988 RepID=A0A4Y8KSG0_9MICO|nr:acyltransferase family protein [Cryobacterium psychrophilum]TDW29681.1 peptidoglycan/LPS O-acetylase OafA/YrhL [Cryobacterium psychrophilum]TFD81791.1 acetyltransferase [Cryobacterium psychrophilum]